MNYEAYKKLYRLPLEMNMSWVTKEYPTEAPIWCSVDLRDGNQALTHLYPRRSVILWDEK